MEQIKHHFGTTNLYEILGVKKDATSNVIKKAYYSAALKYHPDKNKSEDSTQKFQLLCYIHSILTDDLRRKSYDNTGTIDNDDMSDDMSNWYNYWRNLFPTITVDDIESFAQTYRGTEEEKNDLLNSYTKNKGDMCKVYEEIMCCTLDDFPRFKIIIDNAIKENNVKDYKVYHKTIKPTKAMKRKYEEPKAESALNDITQIIKRPNKDNCFDIPDDEFDKIQKKLMKKSSKNKK